MSFIKCLALPHLISANFHVKKDDTREVPRQNRYDAKGAVAGNYGDLLVVGSPLVINPIQRSSQLVSVTSKAVAASYTLSSHYLTFYAYARQH